ESLHPPPRIADRKRDAGPEAVVVAALLALLDQSGRGQLEDREPGPLPARQDLVPGAWGEADPELVEHLIAKAAAREVGARLLGLRRGPQEGRIELGGPGK